MTPHVPRGTNPEPKPQPGSKRLGRGLAQLLAGPAERPAPSATSEERQAVVLDTGTPVVAIREGDSGGFLNIPVSRISPGKYQPRKSFDEGTLAGLAESIVHSGVMQPVVVRPVGLESYELVAGERRWRAAMAAGLREIPAIVRSLSDLESAEWSVTENLQREDLNAMEKGWSLRGLLQTFSLTQEQVAKRLGVDRSSVANLIRLTELEPEIADLITTGRLTAGHGKALLVLRPGEDRVKLARQAAAEHWSVRQTEMATKRLGLPGWTRADRTESAQHAVLSDLERQLGQYLGTKVVIRAAGGGAKSATKGTLHIEYYGLDHFDGLLRKMGFDRG